MKSKETLRHEGSAVGKRGNKFEKDLVRILNEKENLESYKKEALTNDIYKLILNKIILKNNIKPKEISKIDASDVIPKLNSGGNAKTDIFIKLYKNDREYIETLSVKNSSKALVSCHQYTYKDFGRVLDIENKKLLKYFELFQQNPSYKAFEKSLPSGYSVKEFTDFLTPLRKRFCEWVLRGMHDDVNLNASDIQISNFFFYKKVNKFECFDYDLYINKLLYSPDIRKHYSVPFSWTYPSKRRGMSIQLKVPLI